MSERTLTGSAGSLVTAMWRRDKDGKLIKIDEPDRNEYVIPPRATRGRFELCGISDIFTIESPQYGPQKKVRLEYRIEKLATKGLDHLVGKKFTQLFPWPRNIADERAKLGQILSAFLGRRIQEGETITVDDFISTSFVTSTTLDESPDGVKQYAGVSWDTIEPGTVKLSKYVTLNGSAPEPALVGAAVGAGDEADDPFTEDEEL